MKMKLINTGDDLWIADKDENVIAEFYDLYVEAIGYEKAVVLARKMAAAERMFDALSALTDPDGHIWHGAHSNECTGECRDVRAALEQATQGEAL